MAMAQSSPNAFLSAPRLVFGHARIDASDFEQTVERILELWVRHHLASLIDKGVFLRVGAAVDFCAGSLPRAPRWMRASSLEWLFRWCHEPARLTRRYLKDLYLFVVLAREFYRQQLGPTRPDA